MMRILYSKSKERYFWKPKLSKLLLVRGHPGSPYSSFGSDFSSSFGTSLDVLVLHLKGQLGEVGTGFLAGNQSFLLSMKYIDHWMKGKYEYTRNYEQRLIYLSNSIARDLHARVRHGRPSARRFQTAHAFFIHSGNFPSGNKGLLLETARFSVTSFYHHNIKAYCPNRYSITPKVLVMDCLILSSGHNLKLTFT